MIHSAHLTSYYTIAPSPAIKLLAFTPVLVQPVHTGFAWRPVLKPAPASEKDDDEPTGQSSLLHSQEASRPLHASGNPRVGFPERNLPALPVTYLNRSAKSSSNSLNELKFNFEPYSLGNKRSRPSVGEEETPCKRQRLALDGMPDQNSVRGAPSGGNSQDTPRPKIISTRPQHELKQLSTVKSMALPPSREVQCQADKGGELERSQQAKQGSGLLSNLSTQDCICEVNEREFHIDESSDPIPAASPSEPIFKVKKFGVFREQQDILAPKLIKYIQDQFEGKIKPEWKVKVTLGQAFLPSDCKFKGPAKPPQTHRFVVYQFKKPGRVDFRVFECLHESFHNQYSPFSGESLCHKMYSNLQKFYDHLRTHTGEKPFVCSFCDEGFGQKGNLKAHVRQTHQGEKPFKCPQCDQYFSRNNNLKQHLSTHAG